MQPTLCSKCKKNVAVVFISRMNEKGEPVNEGLCLKCAAQLGLPQVEDMMKRMGITPDDLENLNSEMMQAFGGAEELGDVAQANEDGDEDEESGKTATFPFLNRLFGGNNNPRQRRERPAAGDRQGVPQGREEAQVSGQLLHQPQPPGQRGQAGRRYRPGGGDPAGGADPEPPAEEQSLPHR
ncbi:MAG: hypothetical protein ACLR39_05300 [Oscillospiraceae bacterium]